MMLIASASDVAAMWMNAGIVHRRLTGDTYGVSNQEQGVPYSEDRIVTRYLPILTAILASVATRPAAAQVDWLVFTDPVSGSQCGVINAANTELVLLTGTRQLMIVTGSDLILQDTFVDENLLVSFEGAAAGVIDFAEDRDGFRTLWWLTLDGQAVEIDSFSGQPLASGQLPSEFRNVPCDACEFVDFPLEGNCDDLSTNPLVPILLNLCGAGGNAALAMSFCGLLSLRFAGRRRGSRAV